MELREKKVADKKIDNTKAHGMEDEAQPQAPKGDNTRYDMLPKPIKAIFIAFSAFGLALGIFVIFGWNIKGWVMINSAYYYALFALFESMAFLIMPMRKKDAQHIPWYDYALAIITFSVGVYLYANAWSISQEGWLPAPHASGYIAAGLLCLLAVEGGRRMAGLTYAIISIVFFFYPLVADYMPGLLWGRSYTFPEMVSFVSYGSQGIVGLPGMVIGDLLIGFLLFAGILIACGGGQFFLDFAVSLFGRYRGGPAKVAVLGSGLFGSLSGSPISNVVGTGSITIPAMKKSGYPPHYAGAIEAVASTGGVIMPPVMGSVAFIMSILIGQDYATIMIAATIPAFLYYFGLLMQVDSYAAKSDLAGLPKEEIPSVWSALKNGWTLVVVLVFFVVGLLYFRWEAVTPFYASGVLFILSFFTRSKDGKGMSMSKVVDILVIVGKLIAQMVAVLMPAAFILCGFTLTGVSSSIAGGFIAFGGGNILPILLLGVLASFILGLIGIGGYIFMAVTMAPALVMLGLDEVAVHLFILYYSLLSMITPPVAICAFIAANVAQANPMKTAWTAVRLGSVLLFIPFFFVFNPNLVLRGDSVLATGYLLAYCIVGIAILAGGLEGYLIGYGKIANWIRPLLIVGGLLFAYPDPWKTAAIGAVLTIVALLVNRGFVKRNENTPPQDLSRAEV